VVVLYEIKKEMLDLYESVFYLIDVAHLDYKKMDASDVFLSYNKIIRNMSITEHTLNSKIYYFKPLDKYRRRIVNAIDKFTGFYDAVITLYLDSKQPSLNVEELEKHLTYIRNIAFTIQSIYDYVCEMEKANLESLPTDITESAQKQEIVIQSASMADNLSDLAKDLDLLDALLNNLMAINNQINTGKKIYIRKVETGSLHVILTAINEAIPVLSALGGLIVLYANAINAFEVKELEKEKMRTEISKNKLDMAMKILEVDPLNNEAKEAVQKCGISILKYLERNPRGRIGDTEYDTGRQQDRLESRDVNIDHVPNETEPQ